MPKKPADFTSQLGSFLRSTLQQLDSVREVVVQKSKAGKIQIDLTLLRRKRRDALAELGAEVARLVAAGKISDDAFPTLGEPLGKLEEIDERIDAEERRARAAAAGLPDDDDMSWREAERRRAADDGDDVEEYDEDQVRAREAREKDKDDDDETP